MRPNVLFVFSDQHRATDLGCYGNETIQTPNFDRLAQEGVRAETCVSNTPVCGPYRASLMTGMHTHRCRYITNYVPFQPQHPCVGDWFREGGYETGYIGKWHLHFPRGGSKQGGFVPPDQRGGFRGYWRGFNGGHHYYQWTHFEDDNPTPIRNRGYQPEAQADQALEFIRRERERPWALFLSWGPPHTPFDPPPGYAETYLDAPLPPNVPPGRPTEYARRTLPRYYGLVHSLDDAFGRLMAELDAVSPPENTVVVYTSDHGEMLGSHGYRGNKRWPYDASLRIPFIVRQTGRLPAGGVLRKPLGTPDLYPTLAELAGLPAPPFVDGESAAQALINSGNSGNNGERSSEEERREYAYCSMPYAYVPWPGWRALRGERYLYARTKDAPWLLFDLENDPFEQRNLIGETAHAALADELDARLTRRMLELGDSWDDALEEGDWELWAKPRTSKMRSNSLGFAWPGSDGIETAE